MTRKDFWILLVGCVAGLRKAKADRATIIHAMQGMAMVADVVPYGLNRLERTAMVADASRHVSMGWPLPFDWEVAAWNAHNDRVNAALAVGVIPETPWWE